MENIENLFKKFVYTGVGFVSLTTEKMKNAVEKLVSDEKISEEEGKKLVDEFMKSAGEKKEELEDQFKTVTAKVVENLKLAKQKDLEKLENRVAVLEALLAKKQDPKKDNTDF